MNTIQNLSDGDVSSLIDRLVCGELDETARRELLAWLEADARRWRQCGLAFLEAQTWSQALSDWPSAAADVRQTTSKAAPACLRPTMPRRRSAAVLAVCVLMAFGLGLVADRSFLAREAAFENVAAPDSTTSPREFPGNTNRSQGESSATRLDSVALVPVAGMGAAAALQIPVAPAKVNRPPVAIPNYVRRQWERRGYELSVERRYLVGQSPDGERVVVPVERLYAQYVGSEVY